MKVIGVFRVERYKDRYDRFPRVVAPRDEPVAADLIRQSMIEFASRRHLNSIRRPVRRNHRAVEDSRVLRESCDHEVNVYLRELMRRYTDVEFGQHFEPNAEAIGVELLVHARLSGAPQVEIKDARELGGRRQRHKLAAILEPAALDHPVKDI